MMGRMGNGRMGSGGWEVERRREGLVEGVTLHAWNTGMEKCRVVMDVDGDMDVGRHGDGDGEI